MYACSLICCFHYFLSFVVWCLWESSEDDQWSGGRLTYPLIATATRIAAWRVVSKLFAKRIVFLLLPLIYALIRFSFSFHFPESLHYEMVSELRFHSINSCRFPYTCTCTSAYIIRLFEGACEFQKCKFLFHQRRSLPHVRPSLRWSG
ncbi:hypothetical protein, unlikely [Trypanosoma congolense IL3000]|uniref:Uncharacterized protein n=1 Tax=Trypanosoma congolense (strain IL3000) TaxID=1068625 RepID=F9W539_TRYCI|nr:hypothetical protein, unlikely [Trypanosoma congolense IL3000]